MSKLSRSFLKTSTPIRVHTEAPATSSLFGAALLPFPKTFPAQSRIQPSQNLYLTEVFTPPKSSQHLDLLHSYTGPVLKARALNLKLSLIFVDTYATPSFPIFITCTAHSSAGSYGQRHAIPTNRRR